MLDVFLGHYAYWGAIVLLGIGFYTVTANENLVKKVMGLSIFQSAVFVLYISIGAVEGATAPIVGLSHGVYANPLPHVLILTAIVVGVATAALALALVVRIHAACGSVEEDDIARALQVSGSAWAGGGGDGGADEGGVARAPWAFGPVGVGSGGEGDGEEGGATRGFQAFGPVGAEIGGDGSADEGSVTRAGQAPGSDRIGSSGDGEDGGGEGNGIAGPGDRNR